NSLLLGEILPRGCELCIQGAKLVLFITGRCYKSPFCSYYCPISKNRKGKSITLANDRLVTKDDDVLEEVRRMNALGAGFTGGDPLVEKDLVLHYLELLKSEFGSSFHVHLYAGPGPHLKRELFKELKKAGLDEIRFHLPRESWHVMLEARDEGLIVGAEVPAIDEKYLKDLILFLEKNHLEFLNINELEMCAPNAEALQNRGFKLKKDSMAAVEGSEDLALKVMEWAGHEFNLKIHYCPSSLKDSVQFKNRMLRTAKNIRKSHESVTKEGLLYFGIIECRSRDEAEEVLEFLRSEFEVPDDLMQLNASLKRVEVAWEVLEELKEELLERHLKCGFVEELPNHSRQRISFSPL
ncbi:MAG: radical SAM protein, partial [Candidatus Helarchaeales archaeon]